MVIVKNSKTKKVTSLLLVLVMTVCLAITGCGDKNKSAETTTDSTNAGNKTNQDENGETKVEESKKDVITVCTPPVEQSYEQDVVKVIEKFENENKNLKIDMEFTSWGESTQKFETALNAGNPPDLYFINPSEKYIDTGLALSIDDFITEEQLKDYNPKAVEYMKKESKLYGLPLYMPIHTIGGNRKLLEEAGIDYQSVQKNGWTWDEFIEAIKKGTKTNSEGKKQYGFVFSASGVTATELLEHMLVNNGLDAPIDESGNYTYTDPKFLETLQFIVSLIDQGYMPAETNQITAQKRMELFYTEQAMIIGKAIPYYEATIGKQNQDVRDGKAQEGFKEVDFVLLPEPHKEGQNPVTMGGSDGYTVYRQKKYKGDEHTKNVVKALIALTSKDAGESAMKLYLPQVTESGKKLFDNKYTMSAENKQMSDLLVQNLLKPNSMTPAVAKKVILIKEQVIAPKFQALLAREVTPEEMYDAVKQKAKELFN